MRRRKPQSGKAKKEQLQAKRAARKDGQPADSSEHAFNKPPPFRSSIAQRHAKLQSKPGAPLTLEPLQRAEQRRIARTALESRFIKLSPAYIEHYRTTLAKRPFTRPISPSVATIEQDGFGSDEIGLLLCPKRPKWKYYMLKKEVEKNETVMFEKWLADTEQRLHAEEAKSEFRVMGYFERNLDVWRQLWRVTEASEILLVLLDARCPLLHFPPSLQDYISTLKPRKKCILVLTKVDLVPQNLAQAWRVYLEDRFQYDVVMVESYKEREKGSNTQGTRKRFDPGASPQVRRDLVAAVKAAHRELCTPPETMKPETKARWRPRLRSQVDWQDLIDISESASALQNARVGASSRSQSRPDTEDESGATLGMSKADIKKLRRSQRQQAMDDKAQRQKKKAAAAAAAVAGSESESQSESELRPAGNLSDMQKHTDQEESEGEEEGQDGPEVSYEEPPFLSIGLIGQPNVGKSSLLNALLGRKVVRASRTPGKTKALQTIYWSKEVRLVDCPGLVFPSFVGMEKQVMAGVIPIQNVESVIYEIGQRMPLEKILNLRMPDELLDDKVGEIWSTDTLLASLATERGFMTAKAARPDVYRAGSRIIRAFHASQIAWSFMPSVDTPIPDVGQEGIWLPDFQTEAGKHLFGHISSIRGGEYGTGEEGAGTTTMGETTEFDEEENGDSANDSNDDDLDLSEEVEDDDEDEEERDPDAALASKKKTPSAGVRGAFALLSTAQSDESEESEERETSEEE